MYVLSTCIQWRELLSLFCFKNTCWIYKTIINIVYYKLFACMYIWHDNNNNNNDDDDDDVVSNNDNDADV